MPEGYHPFAPRVLNFEEAFPQITDVVIEVEESGKLPRSSSGFRAYSKNDLKERIHCMNIECNNRGFSAEAILRDMVRHNEESAYGEARPEPALTTMK